MTGIVLSHCEKDLSLLQSRIVSLCREKGLADAEEVSKYLDSGDDELTDAFLSAMTTNTTEFFRESRHFDVLKKLLPEIMDHKIRSGTNELRVWCAACSFGHEAYSLAITINEALKDRSFNLKFIATDIDSKAVKTASRGSYKKEELSSVPGILLDKYFIKSADLKRYKVSERLKSDITFARHNLTDIVYPFRFKFDIIFCRNVLIYFDKETVNKIVGRFSDALAPGGYLFLGHSEGGIDKKKSLKYVSASVHRRL